MYVIINMLLFTGHFTMISVVCCSFRSTPLLVSSTAPRRLPIQILLLANERTWILALAPR